MYHICEATTFLLAFTNDKHRHCHTVARRGAKTALDRPQTIMSDMHAKMQQRPSFEYLELMQLYYSLQ